MAEVSTDQNKPGYSLSVQRRTPYRLGQGGGRFAGLSLLAAPALRCLQIDLDSNHGEGRGISCPQAE
jgi:hypothetical protein